MLSLVGGDLGFELEAAGALELELLLLFLDEEGEVVGGCLGRVVETELGGGWVARAGGEVFGEGGGVGEKVLLG